MKKFNIFIILLFLLIPFSFVGCENENKNSLSTPGNLKVENGTIIFDAVYGAEYYIISVNDLEFTVDARFSNSVEMIDGKVNYNANKLLTIGESYTIRVKAISSEREDSSYTSNYSYVHSTNVKKPSSVKTNLTTLTWEASENASYYVVKVVTPNDSVIYDEDGNALSGDDPATIEKAQLTEYSFGNNQFDFASLLTKAGNYNFYVNAVLSDGANHIESGYTSKVTYKHMVTLSAPQGVEVKMIEDNIHMTAVIDPNANSVKVACGKAEKSIELNGLDQHIVEKKDNVLDINLTKFFENVTLNGKFLDLKNSGQYVFKIKAEYVTASQNQKFYIDSDYCDNVIFDNITKLSTPDIDLTYDGVNDGYLLTINPLENEKELIQAYQVYVLTDLGVKEYNLTYPVSQMLIKETFNSVCVKAIGGGNFKMSDLSVVKTSSEIVNSQTGVSVTASGTTLNWTEITNGYYILEISNEVKVLTENAYTLTSEDMVEENLEAKLIVYRPGFVPVAKKIELQLTETLRTPTFSANQGFMGKNLYELTFTGSPNAIGYYVYIKGHNAQDFTKIGKLFTSTAIDMSNYITNLGEYIDYEVKVQAIAGKYSRFKNSGLSDSVSVSHIKVLEAPRFLKVNGVDAPIVRETVAGKIHYLLNFYGVADAEGYEVLINYNKKDVPVKVVDKTGLYTVDITSYLTSANSYEIKVRAIVSSNIQNVASSQFSTYTYILTKQLDMVTNIKVVENDGVYTLTFDPVDNAEKYRVRILKLNDNNYADHIYNIGLVNPFEVLQSADITDYLTQGGEYYVYVTAIAKKGDYYGDSNESNTYATVSKLESLSAPKDLEINNESKDSYVLSWTGDSNADYYLIKVTDPFNMTYELKSYTTSVNINECITIQGDYVASVFAMVNSTGENSAIYENSAPTDIDEFYVVRQPHDFNRYKISFYDKDYDFAVDNVTELKSLLWYHYVYGVDNGLNNETTLPIYLNLKTVDDQLETVRDAIIRLANEAGDNDINLYNFNGDELWLSYIQSSSTDSVLFTYLCKTLIELYPELNILQDFSLDHETGSLIFYLTYKNALNVTKVDVDERVVNIRSDYSNKYFYLDSSARRSESTTFEIDKLSKTMRVSTTEQLLLAIQSGARPEFVGDSEVARTVYNNAKAVLLATVNDKMSDVEKATAIFDWLQYALHLNYYSQNKFTVQLLPATLEEYGIKKEFYLEGVFADLNNKNPDGIDLNGDGKVDENDILESANFDGEFCLGLGNATSESFSKAFALLCQIEGIDTIVVNGTYTYKQSSSYNSVRHTWNKINLSTSTDNSVKNWFAVDLTFSDNKMNFANASTNYEMASHSYFMVTDSLMGNFEDFTVSNIQNGIYMTEKLGLISLEYKDKHFCNTVYDYYENTEFKLTKSNLTNVNSAFTNAHLNNNFEGFKYSLKYDETKVYESYSTYKNYSDKYPFQEKGYANLQNYIVNAVFCATHNRNVNREYSYNVDHTRFEFKLKTTTVESAPINYNYINEVVSFCNDNIGCNLKLKDSNSVSIIKDANTGYSTIVLVFEPKM